MKRGRKPIDSTCPEGYPYRLYEVNGNFVVAPSKEEVRRKTGSKSFKVVKVNDLVAANGHAKTGAILKSLGKRWVCKEGKVYFAP